MGVREPRREKAERSERRKKDLYFSLSRKTAALLTLVAPLTSSFFYSFAFPGSFLLLLFCIPEEARLAAQFQLAFHLIRLFLFSHSLSLSLSHPVSGVIWHCSFVASSARVVNNKMTLSSLVITLVPYYLFIEIEGLLGARLDFNSSARACGFLFIRARSC